MTGVVGDFHRPHIILIITYTTDFVKYERIIKMKNYIIKDVGSCFDVYELLPNRNEKLVFIGFSKDDYTIDLVKKWLCSRYSGKYKIRPQQILSE
jgi:hypothetical protein